MFDPPTLWINRQTFEASALGLRYPVDSFEHSQNRTNDLLFLTLVL